MWYSCLSRKCWVYGLSVAVCVSIVGTLHAEVKVPNVFGDHMVLQQLQKNRIWGTAANGETVTVKIDNQTLSATAGADGKWQVELNPVKAGGPYEISIKGSNEIKISDVLVGEVWVCSGQSNMEWKVQRAKDADLESMTAKFPQIRMINFPTVGSQEPVWTHERSQWMVCTPETVGNFSAVGYFFGRQLHQKLDVPIGLINNAWGGSACEAWIDRETLKQDSTYAPLMESWVTLENQFNELSKKGSDLSADEQRTLQTLRGRMTGNARPGNIYNGVLKSHLGYGIRGVIWYQGESNQGRAYQYRTMFPLMISSWRKEWNQGDFPFYWVQIADFQAEKAEPTDSSWAEVREAQTMTMSKLPNTGEAVIIDIGEGKDIHPLNKLDVAKRLARWALAKDYGVDVAYHSPIYKSMQKQGNKIILTFDFVGRGWRPFDVNEPRGFAIAGEDKKFVWAQAKMNPDNTIEVSSDAVADPVAVRYGWADNPVVNMYSVNGLPLTPFRTDDWPGITINNKTIR